MLYESPQMVDVGSDQDEKAILIVIFILGAAAVFATAAATVNVAAAVNVAHAVNQVSATASY